MRFSKCGAAILWRNTSKLIRVSTPLILFFRLVGRPEWRSAKLFFLKYYSFFLRCFPALLLESRNHFDPLISFSSLVLFDHHGIETHFSHQERWDNRDGESSSSDDELVKSSMMIDGKGRPRGRVIGSQWHVVQLLLQRSAEGYLPVGRLFEMGDFIVILKDDGVNNSDGMLAARWANLLKISTSLHTVDGRNPAPVDR